MPIYEFLNKNTGEIEEHVMSSTLLDVFKQENTHLERHFTINSLPGFGDGMRMSVPGVGQPDARFEREIIGRIKEKVPFNTVKGGHKTKMPREW
jgi:hypothetical protein